MSTKVFRSQFQGQVPAGGVLPQIHLFKDDDFKGDELDLFGGGTDDIRAAADNGWNDAASSAIVISGTWELFFDIGFAGRKLTLTPGVYGSLELAGDGGAPGATAEPVGQGWNDQLSSLRAIKA